MKRYWLFVYGTCYPLGGFEDFYGSYDTIEECTQRYERASGRHAHVFDSVEQKIVKVYNPGSFDFEISDRHELKEILTEEEIKRQQAWND
jgi:hypothetical protein